MTLAKAFKETGFVTDPVQFKPENGTSWQAFGVDAETGEDLGLAQFSTELADAMQVCSASEWGPPSTLCVLS